MGTGKKKATTKEELGKGPLDPKLPGGCPPPRRKKKAGKKKAPSK